MCVQYIGGCSVHRGVFSTSGDTMSTSGGYHEYIGGIPWVHRGDTMSTSGGYHEYIGGCSVHRRDTMSTSGDVQYIEGIPWVHGGISWVHRGMFSTSGGYHDTCGGIPWVHRGMFSTSRGYHEYIGGYHEYIGTSEIRLWYFCCYYGNHLKTKASYLKAKEVLLRWNAVILGKNIEIKTTWITWRVKWRVPI